MVIYNYKFQNLENCSDGKAHRGSSNKLLIFELFIYLFYKCIILHITSMFLPTITCYVLVTIAPFSQEWQDYSLPITT